MKATLTFNLPEERYEHARAIHAMEAFSVMHDIDQHLRSVVKHGEGRYESVEDLAINIRNQLAEILQKVEE
jgi:hypothetical protein